MDPLSLLDIAAARPAPGTPVSAHGQEAARKAAEQFESVFMSQVLDSVFTGVNPGALFGGGSSEKIYRSMMNEQIANHMARSGGVGIASAVYKELIKLQEAQINRGNV